MTRISLFFAVFLLFLNTGCANQAAPILDSQPPASKKSSVVESSPPSLQTAAPSEMPGRQVVPFLANQMVVNSQDAARQELDEIIKLYRQQLKDHLNQNSKSAPLKDSAFAEDMISQLQNLQSQYPESLEHYESMVLHGRILGMAGRHHEARRALMQSLKAEQKMAAQDWAAPVGAHINLAQLHMMARDWQGARQHLQHVLDQYADTTAVSIAKGYLKALPPLKS